MKVEVNSTGRTLKVALEKISLPREREYVQELIDAVEEYERILGVIVYYQGKDLVVRSRSLTEGVEPYLDLIKRSIRGDRIQEEFSSYGKEPVFSHSFPIKDKRGKTVGGVSILQRTSFMEEDIRKAKWSILTMIFVLTGGTVALILLGTRKWVSQPIAQLIAGIRRMAEGDLNTRIDTKRHDELSELAQAFNQMAGELKKAQERIIQETGAKLEMERNLRQSEKLATIGQLASGLAHEIGTPLNIIGGRAELTKRRLDEREMIRKNLDIILQQTERITKIIQRLLGFVRKKKPEQAAVSIPTLLETTADFLDHQIQKQNVKVVKKLEENLPSVTGDADQLQQVFLNLFLNAIQAMPGGGTLGLSASSKWISRKNLEDDRRQYLEICVQDTGVGMERGVVENIFHPFFTTKDQGTGLGLMVSHGIVQDHEGWIEVESEVGRGSVLKVYLPCSQREMRHEG